MAGLSTEYNNGHHTKVLGDQSKIFSHEDEQLNKKRLYQAPKGAAAWRGREITHGPAFIGSAHNLQVAVNQLIKVKL